MKVQVRKLRIKSENIFVKRILFSLCVVLLLEIFVFNLKSFTTNKDEYGAEFLNAQTTTPETVEILEDGIRFNGNGEIIFFVGKKDINAIQLWFSGEDDRFKCSIAIKDDNFSKTHIVIAQKQTSCKYGKFDTSFLPYGELREVKIILKGVNGEVCLNNMVLTEALPFHFSWLRVICLFVAFAFVCIVRSFKLYEYDYDKKSVKQKKVIGFLMLISIVFLFSFYNPEQKAQKYNESDLTHSDAYSQMFDSFYNKRLNLKIEPSKELEDLENPYDKSLRDDSVKYYWDRAYYDGEYYSYYGATPVLLFYFPFYLISGGYVPTTNMTCMFFGVFAIIFMYKTILVFNNKFVKKINFLILCTLLSSAVFISGLAYLINYSNFYTVPPVASTCFLFLCLWTGLCACEEKKKYRQCILYAICGLAFIICFETRATKAVSALVLAPLFIGVLINKKLSVKRRVAVVISFLLPIVFGLIAILIYNYARFDSLFEFGASYQLTVSDIRANKLTWKLFVPAIMHYFFQPPEISDTFPYFAYNYTNIANYGKYMYYGGSMGLLSYPLLAWGILGSPFLLYSTGKKERYEYDKRIGKYTYILTMIIMVFVSWADFCFGGIDMRYVTDIMPLATLLSTWCLLEVHGRSEKIQQLKMKAVVVCIVAASISIILGCGQVVLQWDGEVSLYHSELISVLEELICFWN